MSCFSKEEKFGSCKRYIDPYKFEKHKARKKMLFFNKDFAFWAQKLSGSGLLTVRGNT